MKYLGIEPKRPRIAVFDFTGCEGCELQLANKEETAADFLRAIEVVGFREISSAHSDDYEIALIDGSVTRGDEIERLKAIRERAKVLVAMGSCACFGGVTRLKNAFDLGEANREVYGDLPKETLPTRAIKEIVPVDLEIPGEPARIVTIAGTRLASSPKALSARATVKFSSISPTSIIKATNAAALYSPTISAAIMAMLTITPAVRSKSRKMLVIASLNIGAPPIRADARNSQSAALLR